MLKLCLPLVLAMLSLGAAQAELPAVTLDLSIWRLTLPIDEDKDGSPDEIHQPELARFLHPDYFFASSARGPVVFRAPCNGATTKNSSYPRSELREVMPDDRRAAWATDDGITHTMRVRLAVTKLPDMKPHVVCAQIHDDEDDVIKIRVEKNKLIVERDGDSDVKIESKYKLGTMFDIAIRCANGVIEVAYNGKPKLAWKQSRKGCYFKTGCYTQSNRKYETSLESAGEVVIESVQVTHAEPADKL